MCFTAMEKEMVILVNEQDEPIGLMEKMEAHEKGLLHRAFSVLIFNSKGEMLLQQRALSKYHSPGLWTNACCSHPRNGETILEAANRRLLEEMGMQAELGVLTHFIYKAEFDNGLTEHELDYVVKGITDNNPITNPDEVNDFRWITPVNLTEWVRNTPSDFTVWFLELFKLGIIS
jgi:isopentenyl-diphosphate delta-isomerase